jgi:two-component sensor histidine kinase
MKRFFSEVISDEKGMSVIPLPNFMLLMNIHGGLFLYDFNDKKKTYKTKKLIKKGVPGWVDVDVKDDQGNIWLISRSRELYCYKDGVLKDMSRLFHLSTKETFFSAAYDREKKRLFFCGDSTVFAGDTRRIDVFIPSNTKTPIRQGAYVLTTKKGQVLLHVPGEGIYRIDESDNLLLIHRKAGEKHYGCLYEDGRENIWYADRKVGLQQFRFTASGSLELISTFTKNEGLQNNSIYSLASDSLHRIWISTPAGLDILQKDNSGNWKVFNYGKNTGLRLNDWNFTKLFADASGDIWLCSFRKLIRFDTRNIHLKEEIPKVVIENVQLNMRDVDWRLYTDSLYGYRQLPVNPTLSYADNTLSIHFNGISFSVPPRHEYSYQLLPLDTTWSLSNSNASVSFVNLSPGSYIFKVRTRDQASAWSEPALFMFTITAPFWMRWWFIAACVLAGGSIIYGIYKNRINQLKKLLAIRTKISRDLHDEVGSTLTSISILSKVSQSNLEKDQSKSAGLLQKIAEQSADMQQSMSDIVWSIKPDNDKMENLVIRMREYLGQTAEAKNFEVEFCADERLLNDSLPMQQRQHVFLIFKEAVNNAVKYSQGKKVAVFLSKENHHIKLSVQDDGQGFDSKKITSSNGLKNMQFRAKELKGVLHLYSIPGEGTTVELECPAT